MDGVYSDRFTVDSSIVAGCAGATTLLRAVLLKTCDMAVARAIGMATKVKLYVVVDDITIQGVSASERAKEMYDGFEHDLCDVVNYVTDDLEHGVGGTVSEEKSVIMGSSSEVVEKVLSGTGHRWSSTDSTRNLGIDTSYTTATAKTQGGRIAQAQARKGRFAFLRGFGGQVAAVVRAGPRASMVFGAGVQGATDAALTRIRSTVGACTFGPLGGSSLTLRYMTASVRDLDPVFAMTLGPLRAWAMAIWSGTAETLRKMAIAFDAGMEKMKKGMNIEAQSPGPTFSVLIALRRLGWRADCFHTWVTDRGKLLPLKVVCPRSMMVHGQMAATRWQWRHVAAQYPEEFTDFDHGGDLGPVMEALGKQHLLTVPQQRLLRCAVTRRLWPDFRRAEAGYQESGFCAACDNEYGTIRHALYRCPAMAMRRHCQDLGAVGRFGAKSTVEHHLFTRGVLADVRHEAPPPDRRGEIVWHPESKRGHFEGHVFLDGSRFHGDDPLLARAGWGAVEVRAVGGWEVQAWGAYPGTVQCIDAAEVHAALMAVRLGVPPLHLYSDSAFFVQGWCRGKSWYEAPGRAHADVWRRFWAAVDDFGGPQVLTVMKVKAHATQAMVDGLLISEVDRWGNELADAAAKKGAACHPCLTSFLLQLEVRRKTSRECVRWLGVGLEEAQRLGALPEELTRAQKADRPRHGRGKRLEVVRDASWWEEHHCKNVMEGAHATHSLHKVGQYFFSATCGYHGAQKVLALADPCPKMATPSRKYLPRKMQAGLHPRTGEPLGDVKRVDRCHGLVGANGFTATRRSTGAKTLASTS